ncbi:quinone oxidoreductase family protein [Haloarcula argentinensis]|uniref:NADPH:quinone oxidoreductase family protein n=1 Tax=Haloarcula argentinensis TaxID=43776 RepID=A0ABU2EZW7_HALAR|nr:NADPH:quinone oxidoreductase family protein [Haloarcula argentinensis]EMA18651.1 NAD(P)H quinone oxidoreductase [Haloarcula argentinensis DSM 12282]MDS0253786.1 NADPH:quinone oxidoreductase family protein [Haloarcula argentinensis]
MRVIEVREYGTPTVLQLANHEQPAPSHNELRIEVEAAGVNFADVMHRRGTYPSGPSPPYVPGFEVAGIVDSTGSAVDAFDSGERVVSYVASGTGGYAEYALAKPVHTFHVPDSVSLHEAVAVPIQFLTAHNCLFAWGGLNENDQVLIHAAAGGVGTAAVQLAREAGADVFGTASTDVKLDRIDALGCDHCINYEETPFVEAIDTLTDREGVDLVLDGVGGEVHHNSLRALAPFGRLVAFGVASGEGTQLNSSGLLTKNLQVYGYHYGSALAEAPDRVLEPADGILQQLANGTLEAVLDNTIPLEKAAMAHQRLENRTSIGKIVLTL